MDTLENVPYFRCVNYQPTAPALSIIYCSIKLISVAHVKSGAENNIPTIAISSSVKAD
jgi:hypothetical protein